MPHLPFPSDDSIPEESKEVLKQFQEAYGRPSHIFRLMSKHPSFLKAAWEAWRDIVVKESILKRWVKEAIVVITATSQQAEYCWQGHSNALRRQGLSTGQVSEIQELTFSGYAEPERSIFRFAQKAASNPKSLTAADYEALRKLGLDEKTILEVLAVVWVNTAMNNVVNALGLQRSAAQTKELQVAR